MKKFDTNKFLDFTSAAMMVFCAVFVVALIVGIFAPLFWMGAKALWEAALIS